MINWYKIALSEEPTIERPEIIKDWYGASLLVEANSQQVIQPATPPTQLSNQPIRPEDSTFPSNNDKNKSQWQKEKEKKERQKNLKPGQKPNVPQLTVQQVTALIDQLNTKIPGLKQLWKMPGQGRQAIIGLLSILVNGVDSKTIQFLKSKLQQIGNSIEQVG